MKNVQKVGLLWRTLPVITLHKHYMKMEHLSHGSRTDPRALCWDRTECVWGLCRSSLKRPTCKSKAAVSLSWGHSWASAAGGSQGTLCRTREATEPWELRHVQTGTASWQVFRRNAHGRNEMEENHCRSPNRIWISLWKSTIAHSAFCSADVLWSSKTFVWRKVNKQIKPLTQGQSQADIQQSPPWWYNEHHSYSSALTRTGTTLQHSGQMPWSNSSLPLNPPTKKGGGVRH